MIPGYIPFVLCFLPCMIIIIDVIKSALIRPGCQRVALILCPQAVLR